jgi:hypothetical protein
MPPLDLRISFSAIGIQSLFAGHYTLNFRSMWRRVLKHRKPRGITYGALDRDSPGKRVTRRDNTLDNSKDP